MMDKAKRWKQKRRRMWLALAALVLLLCVVLLPPMVSLGRYKSRIAQLMSESLGRPVRLSSVEMHLLPMPAFVLTNLTVEEDPAYGAEPVLRADTVTASIRLWSLWRGRLEISTVDMDFASINIVRTAEGRWNLDSLFKTAAAKVQTGATGVGGHKTRLPYMEATNARVNFKLGAEKLPFSLLSSELSFWQEDPGDWRIRLRGQPARTDVSLNLADTGIVQLEARVKQARELRQMPIHVDMEWKEAQLGQLARLVAGSDPGWRGDLTGELHLDGTADAALVKMRLRAVGIHRAEFAPASPLDFDASCGFGYGFSTRRTENLVCNAPFGDGQIKLTGEVPGDGTAAHLSMVVDKVAAAAGLDALRTVRSNFAPGLQAKGSISGKFSYTGIGQLASVPGSGATAKPDTQRSPEPPPEGKRHRRHHRRHRAHLIQTALVRVRVGKKGRAGAKQYLSATKASLGGSLTVNGLQLSGGGLVTPIVAEKLVLESVVDAGAGQKLGLTGDFPTALVTNVKVPMGAPEPLTVGARLMADGYSLTVNGQASVARAKELGALGGIEIGPSLDAAAEEPIGIDIVAGGPWMPGEGVRLPSESGGNPGAAAGTPVDTADSATTAVDHFAGTATLHHATWKADYLAEPMVIDDATLHLSGPMLRWDPVDFSYGALKGTASFTVLRECVAACVPQFEVRFKDLDAKAMQETVLGAREPSGLFNTILAKLRSPAKTMPAPTPPWPPMEGTIKADSLALGTVNLTDVAARLRTGGSGVEITDLTASLLSGKVHAKGMVQGPSESNLEPVYTVDCEFEKLSPVDLSRLVKMRWSGGTIDGTGTVTLSGLTGVSLATSAKGTIHFDWKRGGVRPQDGQDSGVAAIPAVLAQFDRWSGDADIGGRLIVLKENHVMQGTHSQSVDGVVALGDPARMVLMNPLPAPTVAKR